MKRKLLFISFLLTLLSQGVDAKTDYSKRAVGPLGQWFEQVKDGKSIDVPILSCLNADQMRFDGFAADFSDYHLNPLLLMMQHAKVEQITQLMGNSSNINTKSLMEEAIQ